MSYLDVSIIIVNWNTCQVTCDCLRSIYEQTKGIAFEIILVDNASSDDSVGKIRQEFPQVIFIENAENRGFAAANNQAMKMSKGRHILLLNPDTIILDGAIQKSLNFAEKNPEAAVIGIRNEKPDGALDMSCFQFASVKNLVISCFGLQSLFPKNRLWGRERYSWWDYLAIAEVDVVAGCYMLVRSDAIEQIGMLDEDYFMYGEEMDWCWRFKQKGWKVLYYPQAKIIHYGGMSAAKNPNSMGREQRKSLLCFIGKSQGMMAVLFAGGLLLLNGLLRLLYWGLRWIFSVRSSKKSIVLKMRETISKSWGQ